jgi:hypothetical protein
LRDQLATIGDKIPRNELVRICLNGFGPSWHCFVHCICAYEHLLSFEGLWDAFVGEETRLETILGSYEDVLDLALIGKVRKGGKRARFGKG